METAPTKGAAEHTGWKASRWSALAVRFVAFLLPAVGSWLAVRVVANWFWRPEGLAGTLCWIIQAVVLASLASIAIERQTRRLLPLAFLLNLSLVFPDQAPSRFRVALRAGSMKKLQASTLSLSDTGDVNDVAARAVELVSALSRHDRRTRGHAERVRAYCDVIATGLDLTEEDRHKLAWGAILHDVGKLTVPSEVLNKSAKLTDAEWKQLQGHPKASTDMLIGLEGWLGDWLLAAGEHHERWDGTGYPLSLAGTEISLAGRITAVADAYDVITSKRSYKQAMSTAAARAELVRCAGTQFDPQIVRAFLEVSLGKRRHAGAFSWLFELPSLSQLGSGVSSAVLTTTAAGSAVLISTVSGVRGDIPESLSFEDTKPAVEFYEAERPDPPSPSDQATATTNTGVVTTGSLETDGASSDTSQMTVAGSPPTTTPGPGFIATTPSSGGASNTSQPTSPTNAAPGVPTSSIPESPSTSTSQGTTTTTQATTTTASPAATSVTLYLLNPGSGNTSSNSNLELSTAAPAAASLPNFDTNRDSEAGLGLAKDGSGLGTNDSTKHQIWKWTTPASLTLNGSTTLDLWVRAKDANSGETIGVQVELVACAATCSSGTSLGTASWSASSQGSTFSNASLNLGSINTTLAPGTILQLKIVAPDNLATTDVVLAYDTSAFAAALAMG